jgi:hypothetical protein
MGDSVFESMISTLSFNDTKVNRAYSITEAEYNEWKRAFTFEGIKGARYGQSFCNHFDITDYVLFYKTDWASADLHIRAVYLAKP